MHMVSWCYTVRMWHARSVACGAERLVVAAVVAVVVEAVAATGDAAEE